MTEQQQGDEEYGEAWRPEPGARVDGKVEGIKMIDPNGKGAYPCVDVRTDDGTLVSIHAFHGVLRRELARRAPRVGDRLGVSYLGKKPGGQNPDGYHNYKVTGGQPREFNWDAELPPEERSAGVSGDAGFSGRATAEPPIAPAASRAEDWSPLPAAPSSQEKAEQFGEAPPF